MSELDILALLRRIYAFFAETEDAGSWDREVQLGTRLLKVQTDLATLLMGFGQRGNRRTKAHADEFGLAQRPSVTLSDWPTERPSVIWVITDQPTGRIYAVDVHGNRILELPHDRPLRGEA